MRPSVTPSRRQPRIRGPKLTCPYQSFPWILAMNREDKKTPKRVSFAFMAERGRFELPVPVKEYN